MKVWTLVLHGFQKLTFCSKLSLAISLLSIAIIIFGNGGGKRIVIKYDYGVNTSLSRNQSQQTTESIASILNRKVRVLCVCFSLDPISLCTDHIKDTWGKRCTRWLGAQVKPQHPFEQSSNETITFDYTHPIWPWIYHQYKNDYDWILRTNDAVYIIMENLRVFVGQYDPRQPYLFGHDREDDFVFPQAYVFSMKALELVTKAIETSSCLEEEGGHFQDQEHEMLGQCFKHVGIKPSNSYDRLGKPRFISYALIWDLMVHNTVANRSSPLLFKGKRIVPDGFDACCSDTAIALNAYGHHGFLLTFEYILYRLEVDGQKVPQIIPRNSHLNALLKS